MISLGFSNLELIFTVSSCIPSWIFISSLSRCLWFHSLSCGSLSDLCVYSVHDLGLATTSWTCYHWFLSPRKQPTFGDATAAWFPREMRSEELAQKFPTDDVLLSWAGQCFWLVENLLQPIKKEHYQIWIVTYHRMDSALLPQTSFGGKTVAAIDKCQPFSQA